jgi:hemerythrin-like domain-containing protein
LRSTHDALAARARVLADGLRAVLAEAEVPREAFVRWCSEFIDDQRQHIEMEEATFFPTVEKMLTENDWTDLSAKIVKSIDPLFDMNVDEKFKQLRQTILAWQRQDEAVRATHT